MTSVKIIIIISYNVWEQSSASANRWLSLIDGISTYDCSINLMIYGGYFSRKEKEKWQRSGTHKKVHYEYINHSLIENYWKIRFHKYIWYHIEKAALLRVIAKKLKEFDGIVWTDSSRFSFKLANKMKRNGSSYKLFLEMSEFLDIHRYNKGNFLQRWEGDARKILFEKKSFYSYDGIALMTKALMRHYKNFPGPHPKLLHLPMTVDLERFGKNIKPLKEFTTPYISFIGVMNDAKDGVSILIKAFNLIKEKYPEHKLYLIGGWNYDTPTHQKLIADNNLKNRVFWMKEFPRGKIPKIICNADLLVLPRPDSKQARGGFPTKLGEYLATGNPVCATRVGEIPDYLKDNESVFFAEQGSVESFAEGMDRALRDPDLSKTVGTNGRKVAEKEFNKEIQAKKLYDLFCELNKM